MKINIGKYHKTNTDRKVSINIEEFDTWSLDHTLALIILPALIQLKRTKLGTPTEFSEVGGEDYCPQYCFDFYKDTVYEAFELKREEWIEILDKMIWSFKQIAFEDYEGQYQHGEPEFDFIKSDHKYHNPMTGNLEDTYQLVDKNPNRHWHDWEGHNMHDQRIQEGLDLFSKYFRNLWD